LVPVVLNESFTLCCIPSPNARNGFSITAKPCVNSHGSGWIAAIFFVLIVLLGGFIMPTASVQTARHGSLAYRLLTHASSFSSRQVLVGVISVAFNESAQKIKTETLMKRREGRVVETARSWNKDDPQRQVSDKQLISLRHVFDALNVGDNEDSWGASLDHDELVPFLEYMCRIYLTPLNEKELSQMFEVIDTSGDGDVSWAEFLWFVLFLRHQYNAAQGVGAPAPESSSDIEAAGMPDLGKTGDYETKEEDFEPENRESDERDKRDDWGLSQSERAKLNAALSPLGIDGEVVFTTAAQHLQNTNIERRAAVLYLLQTLGQVSSHDEQLPSLVQLATAPPPAPPPVRPFAPVSAGGLLDAALPPPRGAAQWSDVTPSFNGPVMKADVVQTAQRGRSQDTRHDAFVGPAQHPVELDIYLCAPTEYGDDPNASKSGLR
jgi:hypothetical protein